MIHLTGTNGKTSTSRMIDTLLRALDLRTGRFTSPHVERMTERISVDGEPLTDEEFVRAFNDVAPYIQLVDDDQDHPLSFFETVVGMAYAAFADAPVDVAVVEVGMGGSWDATNVVDAAVAVVLPIAVDHAPYLGDTPAEIAVEKAGIIKPGSIVVIAEQTARGRRGPARAGRRGRRHRRARGRRLRGRHPHARPSAGRCCRCRACAPGTTTSSSRSTAPTRRRTPPSRWPRSRRSSATTPLDEDVVRAAFAEVTSPGRLEIVRRSPTIVLDAAHNPHGAEALGAALEDSFTFSPLIGVIGVMADKDHEGLLAALEPHLAHVVCTQNSTERAMPGRAAGRGRPRGLRRGPGLGHAAARPTRSRRPPPWPRPARRSATALGSGAVLVTGSVVTVGEARSLLVRPERAMSATSARRAAGRSPRRGMCAAILCLEAITLGLTTPVMISVAGVTPATALLVGLGLAVVCLLLAGMLRAEWAYALGWVVQVAAIGLGFVIPLMFVLGGIFALLWGTAYFLGRKIERERAAAYAAFDAAEPPSAEG